MMKSADKPVWREPIFSHSRESVGKLSHPILFILITALLLPHLFLGCAGSGTPYKREYGRVWKKMIQSEAWKHSMQDAGDREGNQGYVASAVDMDAVLVAMDTEGGRPFIFEEKFSILVKRAYYKIIAEAETADSRLKKEFNTHMERARDLQNGKDRTTQREPEGLRKKYEAHREMLEGLKSWNILSEFGSDDLEFFKAENREKVLQMYQAGQQEERIIYYLVYKLADLYHFED